MQEVQRTDSDIASMLIRARKMARRYGRIGSCDPDDVAQMAMVKLLNKKDGRPATASWLFKVIRTTAYDVGRSHVREAQYLCLFDDLENEQSVCERADQDGYVHRSSNYILSRDERDPDLLPQLKSMLQQLAEPLRRVLVLHAYGFSYEQISEMTKTNLGTVRSRLHYARKKARCLLGDLT